MQDKKEISMGGSGSSSNLEEINNFNYGREKANDKILSIISSFLQKNKNYRFLQALFALNIIDENKNPCENLKNFYAEESMKTLNKMTII